VSEIFLPNIIKNC